LKLNTNITRAEKLVQDVGQEREIKDKKTIKLGNVRSNGFQFI